MRTRIDFVLLLSILLAGHGTAIAQHAKIARDLEGKDPASSVDIIVQFRDGPDATQHQKIFARGGKLRNELGMVKAAAYRIPAGVVEELANDPDVVYISPDRPVRGALNFSVPAVNGNVAAKLGVTGAGVGVAIIDSGGYQRPGRAG